MVHNAVAASIYNRRSFFGMNNVRWLEIIFFNIVNNPPNVFFTPPVLSPLHLFGCDRGAAVVVLIRRMPVLLMGTEGGSVNTTTKERHNWPYLYDRSISLQINDLRCQFAHSRNGSDHLFCPLICRKLSFVACSEANQAPRFRHKAVFCHFLVKV